MRLGGDPLVLRAGSAVLTISPADGGRVASLVIHGEERLVTEGDGPIRWGSYPMSPWAGRIREGRFTFRGRDVQLPRNLPPHAIHGTVFERPWTVDGPHALSIDLGPGWPFAGRVVQRFALDEGGLRVDLELEADEPMPVVVGWHPWFRRPVELAIEPGRMYERGADGLPTGRIVTPGPRPWDDCLLDLAGPPVLIWPDGVRLAITSSADHWVVYDETPQGVCVEPQTGPPDAVNIGGATVVEPGTPQRAWMAWRWEPSRSP